jgi:hypothetical protein
MKKKIIKLARKQLIYVGKRTASDKGIRTLKKPGTKLLWHVTMPKSGSTWVSSILEQGLAKKNWHVTDLIPPYAYGNREQEIDPISLLLKGNLDKNNFFTYQHCLYSDYALRFIQYFDVKLILQVRNIFDCLVSAKDYIEKAYLKVPVAFLSYDEWMKLPEDRKLQFIVDFVAPWYIRFWAGWSTVINNPDVNVKLVSYDDLLADSENVFLDLFRFAGEDVTPDELQLLTDALKENKVDTKKNKGVAGRGQQLPEELKKQVQHYASYYTNTDLSPIGL